LRVHRDRVGYLLRGRTSRTPRGRRSLRPSRAAVMAVSRTLQNGWTHYWRTAPPLEPRVWLGKRLRLGRGGDDVCRARADARGGNADVTRVA
jgi:hypothetical protein